MELNPGKSLEDYGRWCVRAIPLVNQRDIITSAENFDPKWWPKGCLSSGLNSLQVGGNPSAGSIFLNSLIPNASYMNTIRRKAERKQARKEHPYLIAIDLEEMAWGYAWGYQDIINELLYSYFPI